MAARLLGLVRAVVARRATGLRCRFDRAVVRGGARGRPGGTLYPALLRLEKHGLVRTMRERSTSGPPRKYYELTDEGLLVQAERAQTWTQFRAAIDVVIHASRKATAERPR